MQEEWTAQQLLAELTDALRVTHGIAGVGAASAEATASIGAVWDRMQLQTDKKTKQMLNYFQEQWGAAETSVIVRTALCYLNAQSPSLLAFYLDDQCDVRTLSVEDVSRLLGPVADGAMPLDTPHCVYVHVFHVPRGGNCIALAEGLSADACPLQPRSTAGLALQENLPSLIAAGGVRSLAYVGMTTSSTVQERIKLDGYATNRLMAKTWELIGGPSTLLGFADGLARSGPALEVVEFAIVEMLQTFGRGFNLQPGGPFTYSSRRWASLAECMAFASEKDLTTQAEWRAWCKANGEERVRRRVPYEPHEAYKHSGWESWPSFFGRIAYSRERGVDLAECKAFAAEKGLTTVAKWHAWCKANGEERLRRRVPYNPDHTYKGSGWEGWASFFGRIVYSRERGVDFAECKAFAAEKGVTTRDEWQAWCKANGEERVRRGMPYTPSVIYKGSGWESWASFSGANTEAEVKQRASDSMRESAQAKRAKAAGVAYEDAAFVSYGEARAFMAEKGSTTVTEWRAWRKDNREERMRRRVPSNPDVIYKHSGWEGWRSFLREDARGTKHK